MATLRATCGSNTNFVLQAYFFKSPILRYDMSNGPVLKLEFCKTVIFVINLKSKYLQ